ncbi:MAG: hypothetical protein AB1295_00810 [Candidatus Micrarchaeota archaeon]
MRTLFFALALLMLLGCAQKAPETPAVPLEHNRGQISFQYPDWPAADNADQNFLVRNNGTCVFAAAEYPAASPMLKDVLESELHSSFQGEYLDFDMSTGGQEFDARTRMVYCDYKTYTFTIACIGELQEERLLESVRCAPRQLDLKKKLGLIPIPPNQDPALLAQTFRQARADGAEVLYWYLPYRDVADNWTLPDYVMEPMSYEGKSAVVIEVIHTNVLAEYPKRYSSFTDEGFSEEFSARAAEFAERYDPDYLFVGNEVDDYLWERRELIPEFKDLLEQTRIKVHAANPRTKVGFTVTYHDTLTHNATDITKTLAEEADIIGYTDYGYRGLFRFDNVSRGLEYLGRPADVVPGKPFAIVEAGWSSSPLLGSSEALQEEYAEGFFAYLEDTDAEFVNWFALHDGVDCSDAADSFLKDLPQVKEDESFMEVFKEFLCSLGIKHSDGTPKKAWSVWQENT